MVKNPPPQEDRKQKILDQILKKLKSKIPDKLRKSAQTFAEIYYANVSLEDLTENSLDTLVSSVNDLWNFSLERTPGKAKIRVFVEKREIKGHPTPFTIVEIVNDNMPFLVDSVTAALNSLGYSIRLVIHPVMQVERNKANTLKTIFQRNSEHASGTYESFIHCEILEGTSKEELKAIEAEIMRALNSVRSAVEDWFSMRTRLQDAIKNLTEHPPHISKEESEETLFFLKWIEDNHFTFLGFCEYNLVPGQTTIKRSLVPEDGLGVLRDPSKQEITQIFEGVELSPTTRRYILEQDPLIITKTTQVSLVHRRDPMDSITIKRFDKNGNMVGIYQFVGLFTSVVYNRSAQDIPLLRRKVARILARSGFSEQWHDGKTLIHLLESFPRDELFQASEDWLFETTMAILQLQNRQRLTLFIRFDKFERYVSCIVYVPRERYDAELREKIGIILEEKLKGKITNWQSQLGELAFARIHYVLRLSQRESLAYDVKAIEEELVEASLTWRDHLHLALFMKLGEEKSQKLFESYGKGFSRGYQERFTADEAITDIFEIEEAFSRSRLRSYITQIAGQDESKLRIKIYSLKGPLSLSDILPVLENMNLKVLNEIPFGITRSDNQRIWMHDFEVQTWEGEPIELDHIRDNFLDGFSHIWRGKVENDGFNRLIIRANFTWRECQLIRAYAKYIRQLQVTYSQDYMEETLAKYPHACHLMMQLFTCQFALGSKEDRERAREEIFNKIKAFMRNVDNLDEDRILSKFVNAISSTLRTNYYQFKEGKPKSYVSFKIDCAAIEEMPLPRPLYEIFVYSSRVEGLHLRGGKVARGGIRWSDRKEDFRSEVLGLMKAQMVKNAVIVPVGSKGGFIAKRSLPREDRNALMEEVVACYKIFIRGLLDLTDNIQGQDVIPPPDVIRRDDDDPYLVVAADKGTATFSDYANGISAEYNFWLEDAFASGGSTGYDHKKIGITAKGLMKAQMVKNAVIVPVGSKGGFIAKRSLPREDRNALMEEVVACYKIFIRGLLDLTDNIQGQDVIPPPDVIRRDDDDPYLVVAADKGTATFSDYANGISAEYNFWLEDAFASGGSTGYDHKKIGITAKGAWASVERHFREMGIDPNRQEITVVGIGDMSGDVFGNGMLLSHHLKLIAAFNHAHIFIDPSPHPSKSYEERKRLFELPRSTWADYNPARISKGGGVFDRQLKVIEIPPEMKTLLGIQEDHLSPSALIRYILKASADLMWFGGIGTFIKSKAETNIEVGDRLNDSIRINGAELRVKVVAEGANLGVTQLGRIEYAKNGGRINTDAIDNSAGVDCSDHEVNIKVLLRLAIEKGDLTLEKRNSLLELMTDDVERLVLKDNFWQNQAISLSRSQGVRLLDEQSRLMRDLESEGYLNRALEFLPDETEIARRMADKQGLTSPEIAVLLAYSKISLNHQLIQSELPDLAVLQPCLLSYFPERLQHAYRDEIKLHPLRREITATLFTNSIVNRMGITFVHEMKRQAGVEGADVARAYFVVRELLDLVSIWRDLESLEALTTTFQTELMLNIYENVKRITDWFLRFNKDHKDIEGTLSYFKPDFEILKEDLSSLFIPKQTQSYKEKCQDYMQLGLSSSLAERLIDLEFLVSAPDMVTLSKETEINIEAVARVYFALGQQLGFEWLRKTAFNLSGETHWQQGAASALIEDLYVNQRVLTKVLLVSGKPVEHLFKEDGTLALEDLHTTGVESILFDVMNASTVDFAMMTVVNRRLRMLAQGA